MTRVILPGCNKFGMCSNSAKRRKSKPYKTELPFDRNIIRYSVPPKFGFDITFLYYDQFCDVFWKLMECCTSADRNRSKGLQKTWRQSDWLQNGFNEGVIMKGRFFSAYDKYGYQIDCTSFILHTWQNTVLWIQHIAWRGISYMHIIRMNVVAKLTNTSGKRYFRYFKITDIIIYIYILRITLLVRRHVELQRLLKIICIFHLQCLVAVSWYG